MRSGWYLDIIQLRRSGKPSILVGAVMSNCSKLHIIKALLSSHNIWLFKKLIVLPLFRLASTISDQTSHLVSMVSSHPFIGWVYNAVATQRNPTFVNALNTFFQPPKLRWILLSRMKESRKFLVQRKVIHWLLTAPTIPVTFWIGNYSKLLCVYLWVK